MDNDDIIINKLSVAELIEKLKAAEERAKTAEERLAMKDKELRERLAMKDKDKEETVVNAVNRYRYYVIITERMMMGYAF